MGKRGVEHAEQWYDDGPWSSTRTDRGDACGYVGYLVSDEAEPREPIIIVPLKQGFVVSLNMFEGEDDDLAFTDAFDLAEWLLAWLGFDEGLVKRVRNALVGGELVDREAVVRVARSARGIHASAEDEYHKRIHRAGRWADHHLLLYKMEENHEGALDVAEAAEAFLSYTHPPTFDALKEAVKKWQSKEGSDGCY